MSTNFDWLRFLESNNIEYVESGPNVKRGDVNIACPLCGDDPSAHMGLNLETGAYACWRDPSHRGRNPARVIRAILRCTSAQAQALVEEGPEHTESDFDRIRRTMEEGASEAKDGHAPRALKQPPEFFDLSSSPSGREFRKYLRARGFHGPRTVSARYRLCGALTGEMKYRVIFPVEDAWGLVGWTGRAITPSRLRYYAMPAETVKSGLFNYANAVGGGKVLVIAEGPVDAMKIDNVGIGRGVRSVAIMTVSISTDQVTRVAELSRYYDRVAIWLDPGAYVAADRVAAALRPRVREAVSIVRGDDHRDPGAMAGGALRGMVKRIVAGY